MNSHVAPRTRNGLHFAAFRHLAWAMGAASILTLLLAAGTSAVAKESAATQAYPVSRIVLEYAEYHPDHPALSEFAHIEVLLSEGPEGLAAPRAGQTPAAVRLGEVGLRRLTPTAIREINRRVVEEFNRRGFAGVLVEPSSRDIDPQTNADIRPSGQEHLHLVIWTGRVTQLRTFASGERVSEQARIDNPRHVRIKDRSPIVPVSADGGGGDLLRLGTVEDYLERLNRHPGRRVDVSLVKATFDALTRLNSPRAVATRRGKKVADIIGRRGGGAGAGGSGGGEEARS